MTDKLLIPSAIEMWSEKYEEIHNLMNSRYGDALLDAYGDLDLSVLYMSRIHGIGHIERTMLFGALIAMNEELNKKDTWMVLRCCSYHDVGRVNDLYDLFHGKRSSDKMLKSPIREKLNPATDGELLIMRAAVAAHSVPDKKADKIIEKFEIENVDYFMKITSCLKDADNLDRVRLGDLDSKHLRHEKTVRMVPLAENIFREYSSIRT